MEIVADLHVHTVASGHAYSTVWEIAREAEYRKLKTVAITDHGPAMPGGPHEYYFGNMKALPRELFGVRILRGVEANIVDTRGTLDLTPRFMKHLDLVLAGFHTDCFPSGRSREEHTRAIVNAIAGGWVDIIVHPGNPLFKINIETVVKAAKKYSVALEINNSSLTGSRKGSQEICPEIAAVAGAMGATVSLGSDSHWAGTVGELDAALELALQAGIKPENILNTSLEKLEDFLEERNRRRPKRKK